MFRRIHSFVSPMSAMRIDAGSEVDLGAKLHMITEYLVNSQKQFDSWMELQNHNRLHLILAEIYDKAIKERGIVSEERLIAIIQFYTLLIINCKDELLICKLVSDDFVISMCELNEMSQSIVAELDAYRINLIKAYLGTVTRELIKYMVVQDRFKVFQTCVHLYLNRMGSGTVEATTIANTLLNVISKLDLIPFLWDSVWVPQGMQILLSETLSFIYEQLTGTKSKTCSMKEIETTPDNKHININEISEELNKLGYEEKKEEGTKESFSEQKEIQSEEFEAENEEEIKVGENKKEEPAGSEDPEELNKRENDQEENIENNKKEAETLSNKEVMPNDCEEGISKELLVMPTLASNSQKLPNWKEKFETVEEIVMFLTEIVSSIKLNQIKEQICAYCYLYLTEILEAVSEIKQSEIKAHIFSILFTLFKELQFEAEAVGIVISSWFDSLLDFLEGTEEMGEKESRAIFVLCKIVLSKYSLLSERGLSKNIDEIEIKRIAGQKERVMKVLVSKLKCCLLSQDKISQATLLPFIKNILLTAFHLKLAMSEQNDSESLLKLSECLLELFLTYCEEFKKLMYQTELWGNIIKWYEESTIKVANNILIFPENFESVVEDNIYVVMLIYEYLKCYRFMIVEDTTLDPKTIKQEKFYHSMFSSTGMSFAPGSTISEVLNVVCPCLFHHNLQQIPVVVLEDKECFIIAIKIGTEEFKILLNIKFKDIEGAVYGSNQGAEGRDPNELPKFVRINLRGSQQIVLEFSNPQVVGVNFKDYLARSRELTRQRQLTFLNAWIKDYEADTEITLEGIQKKLNKEDNICL